MAVLRRGCGDGDEMMSVKSGEDRGVWRRRCGVATAVWRWRCGDSVGCVDGGTAMAVGRWRCSSGGGAMTVV